MSAEQPDQPGPVRLRQQGRRSVSTPMRSTSTAVSMQLTTTSRPAAASSTSGPATSRARSTAATPASSTTAPWSTTACSAAALTASAAARRASLAAGDLRSELQPVAGRHAPRLVPAAGSAVCGRRAVHAGRVGHEGPDGHAHTYRRLQRDHRCSSDRRLHRQGPWPLRRSWPAPSAPGAPTKLEQIQS